MGYCKEAAKAKANEAAQQCGCDPQPCVADAKAEGCGTCVSCIAGKLGMSAEDLIKKAKSMATEELLQEFVQNDRDDCDQCNNDPNRHNCEEMGYCKEAAKAKANEAAQQCGCDPQPCVADAKAEGCGTCVSCIAGKLGMSAEDLIKKAKSMATEELLQEKVKNDRDDCDQCNNDPNRHNCEEMGYCKEAAKAKANEAAQQCGRD